MLLFAAITAAVPFLYTGFCRDQVQITVNVIDVLSGRRKGNQTGDERRIQGITQGLQRDFVLLAGGFAWALSEGAVPERKEEGEDVR